MAFTARQLAAYTKECTEAFCFSDSDHDGKLTIEEVANAMRCAGQYPTPDQIEKLIKGPGGGGKGGINLKQFMAMLKQHASENSDWQEELLEAFKHFDEDGGGTITADELTHAVTKIGHTLSKKQAMDFVKEADLDGDGEINYEEFVRLLTSGRVVV